MKNSIKSIPKACIIPQMDQISARTTLNKSKTAFNKIKSNVYRLKFQNPDLTSCSLTSQNRANTYQQEEQENSTIKDPDK